MQSGDSGAFLGEFLQAAVSGTGVQCRQVRLRVRPLALECLDPGAEFRLVLPERRRPRRRVTRGLAVPRELLQFAGCLARAAAQCPVQIAAVVGEEGAQCLVRPLQASEVGPYGVEVVEVAGHVVDDLVVEGGQCLGENGDQAAGVDAVADRGAAEPVEEVEQVAVAGGVGQAEQFTGDPGPVLHGPVGDVLRADERLELVHGERLAGGGEVQLLADPERGGEEERLGRPGRLGRADGRTEGEVLVGAHLVRARELHPQVAQPVGPLEAVEEQPQEGGAPGSGGVQGAGVAVEQVRQQHFQGLGLAGAVLAAQQQPAVAEGELLLVVLPDVADAGAVQAVAVRGRRTVHRGGSWARSSVGDAGDCSSVRDLTTTVVA